MQRPTFLSMCLAVSVLFFSCSKSDSDTDSKGTADQPYSIELAGSYASANGKSAQVIRLQKDGKILVFGYGWFVRLQTDGVTVDNSFSVPADINTASAAFKVQSFVLQEDGKILVFGTFVLPGGRKAIVRLNADGSLDNSFNNPVLDINYYRQSIGINEVYPLANGKLIIAGAFSYKVGNVFGDAIARLNTDQTIDPSFVSPISGDDPFGVTHMQALADGRFVLLGYGAIKLKNGVNYNVVRISADGVYDAAYVMETSYPGGSGGVSGYSTAVALQGARLVIGVGYLSGGGNILRLNENGSRDATFPGAIIGYETVNSILVNSDNSLLIGRNQSFSFSDTPDYLNFIDPADVQDTSFHMTGFTPGGVKMLLRMDDKTVLAAGSFTHDGKYYALLRLRRK